MDSKKLKTGIATEKIVKRGKEYNAVFEILFREEDLLKGDDKTIDEKIDGILDEVYKANPGFKSDNSILWDIVWLVCCCEDIVPFIYYLQQKGIKNKELALAFGSKDDLPFQIFRKLISTQKLKEFTDEIEKNRRKNVDPTKSRSRIIRLLLQRIYNRISEYMYPFLDTDFISFIDNNLLIYREKTRCEKKVYKLNQWDCQTPDAVKTLIDMFHEVWLHGFVSLKSMEFPFSPFYSSAVEVLLNFGSSENMEITLKTLNDEIIKDARIRMAVIQEGIKSIREGEHPLLMLWNIGHKYEQLKEPLNKKYDYPLFLKDIETEEWGQDVDKIILEKVIRNKDSIKEVNFWAQPLENIVNILMHSSWGTRRGGLFSLGIKIPDVFRGATSHLITKNPFQTEVQKTYKFLFYGVKMAENADSIETIAYCMDYNASLIIQNLNNHLELVTYCFCQIVGLPGFNPNEYLKSVVPEYILGDV